MEPNEKEKKDLNEAHEKVETPSCDAWHPFSYNFNRFPGEYPYVEPHFHPEFEIDYIVSGQLIFNIGNQEIPAKEGDIFIIHPNEIHSIYPCNPQNTPATYHTFLFVPNLLAGSISERCLISLFPVTRGEKKVLSPITKEHPYYSEIQTSIENIIVGLKENTALHDMMIKSELLRIFFLLLQYDSEVQTTASKVIPSEIYTVLKYIAENYTEKISTQELSKMTYLSHSRFLAVFKQTVGTSPTHYLNFLRIKKACRMLVETPNETVINIANACGFNNISNFNVQFKRTVEVSPIDYRNRFKKTDETTADPDEK